jgi:serine/threonine protein phosphatase PrpC
MANSDKSAEGAATIVTGEELAPVRHVDVGTGAAVVYSARSPEKETPNEDAAAILRYGKEGSVLVVADGVGGERSGTLASKLAVKSLAAALKQGEKRGLELRIAILDGIEKANYAVGELSSGAATTVAVMQVEGTVARPFHVGDSGILVVGQRGKIKHQNIAHGPVGYAVEAGLLDAGEALHHDERNVVSNVVGSLEMRIEVGPKSCLAARDTVLVATDGLFDNLYVEEIVERIRMGPLETAAELLADTCDKRMVEPGKGQPSKPDDLTFILYRSRRVKKPDRA